MSFLRSGIGITLWWPLLAMRRTANDLFYFVFIVVFIVPVISYLLLLFVAYNLIKKTCLYYLKCSRCSLYSSHCQWHFKMQPFYIAFMSLTHSQFVPVVRV